VRALPPWTEPAELAGRVALYESITTREPSAQEDALRWNRLATGRDRTDSEAWTVLAEAQLHFGQSAAAQRSFRQALWWDPWSVRALNGLATAAQAQGDLPAATSALERSLRAAPDQPKARTQLNQLERRP
jgi:Tfp pilus assembly protein PilF